MAREKPARPHGFPLNPHNSGQWSKSIKNKDYYFGPWDDPAGALVRYHAQLEEMGLPIPSKSKATGMSATTVGSQTKPRRTRPKVSKPDKPYPGFPLYAHGNGQWCKEIRGKTHYFGPWADPDAALTELNRVLSDLKAGRRRRPRDGSMTLYVLANKFLDAQLDSVNMGHNKRDTYKDYKRVCEDVCEILGKQTPIASLTHDDFVKLRLEFEKLAADRTRATGKSANATTLRNMIIRARVLFNFSHKSQATKYRLPFMMALPRPPDRILRAEKHKKQQAGKTMFQALEILKLIEVAHAYMKPGILLGINGGFGPRDLVELRWDYIDFDSSMITFPRPKSAIQRSLILWPETVEALLEWKKVAPKCPWVCCGTKGQQLGQGSNATPIPHKFDLVMKRAKIDHDGKGKKIQGRGFYCLRHSFETVASECNDQIAVDHIMGHASHSISDQYRETPERRRILKAVKIVRKWLYANASS